MSFSRLVRDSNANLNEITVQRLFFFWSPTSLAKKKKAVGRQWNLGLFPDVNNLGSILFLRTQEDIGHPSRGHSQSATRRTEHICEFEPRNFLQKGYA
jgi:hypothetical protein